MRKFKRVFLFAALPVAGLYLCAPVIAGFYHIGDRTGPRIYPAWLHRTLYDLRGDRTQHEQHRYDVAAVDDVRSVDFDFGKLLGGDLLFIAGQSVYSDAVRQFDDESVWTHVGLIDRQDDELYLIDASPMYRDSADQPGRVMRQPLAEYLRDNPGAAIAAYRVQCAEDQREQAVRQCRLWAKQAMAFDGLFDATCHDELYCSEMIWAAYRDAGVDLVEQRWRQVKIMWVTRQVIVPDALVQSDRLSVLGHIQKGTQ